MTMMTVQLQREYDPNPGAEAGLSAERGFSDDKASAGLSEEAAAAPSSAGPFGWFRNQRIGSKINTIFASFSLVISATVILMAFGVADVFQRYQVSDQLQRAITAAGDLRADLGDVRYQSSRYLFNPQASVLTSKSAAMRAAKEKIDLIDEVTGENAESINPQVAVLRTEIAEFEATFKAAQREVDANGRTVVSDGLSSELFDRTEAMLSTAEALNSRLYDYNKSWRGEAVSAISTAITWAVGLVLLAALLLISGFGYLSRDLVKKVREIKSGMNRLANGDRKFDIEGDDRKDEIGEMLRALAKFKRANRQLELWARERSEHAEQEIRAEQERAREREEAEAHRVALIADRRKPRMVREPERDAV